MIMFKNAFALILTKHYAFYPEKPIVEFCTSVARFPSLILNKK